MAPGDDRRPWVSKDFFSSAKPILYVTLWNIISYFYLLWLIFSLSLKVNESKEFEIPYVLNEVLTIDEIETKIKKMKYLEATTYTYYALRRASEVRV